MTRRRPNASVAARPRTRSRNESRRVCLSLSLATLLMLPSPALAGPPAGGGGKGAAAPAPTSPAPGPGASTTPASAEKSAGTASAAAGADTGPEAPAAAAPTYGIPGEPGSGVAIEPTGSPRADRLSAPLPLRPADPSDLEALDASEEMLAKYREAAEEVDETIDDLLVLQGEDGRHAVDQRYAQEIRKREGDLRALRSRAVERYDEFLAGHPDDPLWTPEILFRLGELHFVTAEERYRRQEDAWQAEVEALQADPKFDPKSALPAAPKADYSAAAANFRGVVERFPKYPYADASLYMLGVLLLEQEDYAASRQAFLALACSNKFAPPPADFTPDAARDRFRPGNYDNCVPNNPDSKHLAESWLRIGEMHYDLDEFDGALAAYERAAEDPTGELFDEALIRIAWTLYLERRFAESVTKLDEFVRWADSVASTKDGKGAASLRKDAIRYIAKAYVEEDWDGDGRTDKIFGLARLDRDYGQRTERHVAEIYAALGDLRAYETEFARAIKIWEQTLLRFPLAPAAPEIQDRIMQAWMALREDNNASIARDKLATAYLRGTPWFAANESDFDAIETALKLAEDALVATAIDHHGKAQKLRSEGDPRAAEEYRIAARAYAAFLERFPEGPNSYRYRYEYAESLYYSNDFAQAAVEYAAVRDSYVDNRLQKDAAEGVMFAREAVVEGLKTSGKLIVPEMPRDGSPGPFDPVEIPAELLELQRAYDGYVALFPDADDAGRIRYDAAELSQRYNRFAESQPRFEEILARHCKEDIAINAGYAIVDLHVVTGDLTGTREWTDKLVELKCGSEGQRAEAAGKLRSIGNAVRFQEATLLLEAGEFEAAADRYVALVDEAPDDPNADRALNNAAVAYENIGRFGSASKTYERIYTKYPSSEFADDALLRAGFNHAKFFEFEEAVDKYIRLAEDKRYEASEHRSKSLKSAASLTESLQDYRRASALYAKYAQQVADPAEKAEGLFLAAEAIAKTGDHAATVKAYRAFVDTHGGDPKQTSRTVEAWLKIGKEYLAMKKKSDAEQAFRQCVSLAQLRAVAPASDAAEFPAQAQFLLAEAGLEAVLTFEAKGTGKKLTEQFKRLFEQLIRVSADYDAVFPWRRLEWTLAAMFRRGYGFETVATKVRNSPVPKQLKEYSEAWFAYKDIIANEMQAFEDKAVSLYEETVKRSVEFKLSTEYTKRARERLNVYKPDEYPLLRDPALDVQVEDRR